MGATLEKVSRWFRHNIIGPEEIEDVEVLSRWKQAWSEWTELQPAGPNFAGYRYGRPCFSRRWAKRAGERWAVVLMDWWLEVDEESSSVQHQTWAFLCTDPHDPIGTATWQDSRWDYVSNVESTDDGARQAAATYTWDIEWDGTVEE